MVALGLGVCGLLVGRAKSPKPPAPIRIGAFTLDAGNTWRRAVGTGDSDFIGASLAGAAGETATVGIVGQPRLPGDPVAATLLDGRAKPRAVAGAGVLLITYSSAGDRVVARPTTKGRSSSAARTRSRWGAAPRSSCTSGAPVAGCRSARRHR